MSTLCEAYQAESQDQRSVQKFLWLCSPSFITICLKKPSGRFTHHLEGRRIFVEEKKIKRSESKWTVPLQNVQWVQENVAYLHTTRRTYNPAEIMAYRHNTTRLTISRQENNLTYYTESRLYATWNTSFSTHNTSKPEKQRTLGTLGHGCPFHIYFKDIWKCSPASHCIAHKSCFSRLLCKSCAFSWHQ